MSATPIPHGTRTGYRKHNCRCLACLTYQRGLAKRHRDRMTAAGRCRDCGGAIVAPHVRCEPCRERRNVNQRRVYQPRPRAVTPIAAPKARPVDAISSWWLDPRCQTDRAAFMAELARRRAEAA